MSTKTHKKKFILCCTRGTKGNRYWYFRLVAGNGRTVCQSEVYNSKAAALNGIRVVAEVDTDAVIEEVTT